MLDQVRQTFVLYHGDSDGFASACVARNYFGADNPSVQYLMVYYGQKPHVLPDGSDVYIVDFHYDKPTLIQMRAKAHQIVVLDHHKTTVAETEGLDFVKYSDTLAGVGMTWQYFYPGSALPLFFQYVQDYDLWQFKLPESRAINAAIQSYPMEFAAWDAMLLRPLCELQQEGAAILRVRDKLVEIVCNTAEVMDIPIQPKSSETIKVPVIQTPILISEVGHVLNKLYPHHPFSMTWFKRKAGQFKWSLRSTKENGDYDVAAFAKEWGGGGHHNAAGFVTKKPIWVGSKKGIVP